MSALRMSLSSTVEHVVFDQRVQTFAQIAHRFGQPLFKGASRATRDCVSVLPVPVRSHAVLAIEQAVKVAQIFPAGVQRDLQDWRGGHRQSVSGQA